MDEKASQVPESEALYLVRAWMAAVGGGVSIGDSKLKSAQVSKSGNKLTIVLKKKAKKAMPEHEDAPSS